MKPQFTIWQLIQITGAIGIGFGAWNGHCVWPANDDRFALLLGFALIVGLRTCAYVIGLRDLKKYFCVTIAATVIATIAVSLTGPYEFPFSCYRGRFSIGDFVWVTFLIGSLVYLVVEFFDYLCSNKDALSPIESSRAEGTEC